MFCSCCVKDEGNRPVEPISVPFDAIGEEDRGSPGTVTATLCRESTSSSWGFFVDLSDAARVHICRLDEGHNAAADYNKNVQESEHMRVFDYVVALNGNRLGTESDAKNYSEANMLMAGLSSMLRAVLTLQRPTIFDADVVRSGEPWGLDINFYGHGVSFGITSVLDEGAARRCTPKLEICDRIIAVNGTRGDPDLLQQILREAEDAVTFTVSRRPL